MALPGEHFMSLLKMIGLTNFKIKFDAENRQVTANFIHAGAAGVRTVSFDEIEAAFCDGPQTHQIEQRGAEPVPGV